MRTKRPPEKDTKRNRGLTMEKQSDPQSPRHTGTHVKTERDRSRETFREIKRERTTDRKRGTRET